MSLALELKIPVDTASPALARIEKALGDGSVARVAGRSLRNTVRSHLFAKNTTSPNRLGGTRTNFYASAARGVQNPSVSGNVATVSINQVGIRQRYYGGRIDAKPGKLLTIPADASAHGRRAREFSNLHAIYFRGGQSVGALVDANDQVMFWLSRFVVQKPDPSVLPTEAAMLTDITRDVREFIVRTQLRGGATA